MIVKTCKIHGDLTLSDVHTENVKYKLTSGEQRETKQYRCAFCRREKDRIYKLNNPDKHKASASRARNEARRLFREGISNVEPRANVLAREDRKNNPEKHLKWSSDYRARVGQYRNTMEVCRRLHTTPEAYFEMQRQQDNKCAICGLEETRKSRTDGKICALAIDHCHACGEIRALLCHSCNTGIGKFKDDIGLLQSAIQYLQKHEHMV